MPEGPEILYSSIVIRKLIKKYTFSDITSFSDKEVVVPKQLKDAIKKNISGKIIDVNCKGKLLWIELENTDDSVDKENMFIHIHYGLTGWLVDTEPDNYIKYKLTFTKKVKGKKDKQKTLFMKDKRRFSKIQFMTKKDHDKEINKLGIDIFSKEFTVKYLKNIMKSKKVILASFIMNQQLICGIGNYIKNDAMFLAKLKVSVKTSELSSSQIKDLHKYILFISYSKLMTHLTDSKITKYLPLNKEVNKPDNLEIPYEFKAYNQTETKDGEKIIKVTIGGRDSYSTKEYIPETTKVKKPRKSSNEKGYQNKKITDIL